MKKGASLLFQFGWCGFGLVGGPLGCALCVGFVSVQFVPYLITEWIKRSIQKLK